MASKSKMFGCSNLKRRARYLPRCESLWSTNPRSKSLITGPPTSECKTGCENHIRQKHSSIALLVIASLLSSLQFNTATKDINVSSHNLHGFKTSSDYHRSCISQYGGIWMGQEHWLSNKQLHQFQSIKAQYYARSGMEEAVSSGVLKGRPFGGVSIAWSNELNHAITPLTQYKHKRVVAIQLETFQSNVIFISVYMPFLDSRKRDSCLAETVDTISMIEMIIDNHPQCSFVIGGDLNCELNGASPFDKLWDNLASKKQLAYCSSLFSSPGYTYHHESLNQ